jgi:signal transduction histidine kinase
VARLPAGGDGGGHGIEGMRERAAALGGTLSAGAAEGGFRVTATVPAGPSRHDQGAARR